MNSELTKEELENLRCQFGTSSWGGTRYTPMAFTEQGVAQLSCVLNSQRAIKVNIQIIRLFTKMRKLLLTHKDLILKMQQFEVQLESQGQEIKVVFAYLKEFLEEKSRMDQANRKGSALI